MSLRLLLSRSRPLLFPRHLSPATAASAKLRPFCSGDNPKRPESEPEPSPSTPKPPISIPDVSNTELKRRLDLYYGGDESILPSIMDALIARRLSGKHQETDDELMEELRNTPLPEVDDGEFESDFEEMHDTDEELPDLYNAKEYVQNKMMKDEFFNMDDKKWDDMVKEAIEAGQLKDTKDCEGILEDMLNFDKLLPGE